MRPSSPVTPPLNRLNFDGPPTPLDRPITKFEVEIAAKRLKNGKANGPDNMPNELIKYGGLPLCDHYARIINSSFEVNKFLHAVALESASLYL